MALAALVALAATVAAPAASAAWAGAGLAGQEGTDTAETVTVLEGVYTDDQADRGEATFQQRCAGCHAPAFFEANTFVRAWVGRPVRSMYRRIRQTMPEDNPGGLRPREYASVIAYILRLNAYPAGETALPSDEESLRLIIMVEKEKEDGGG